VTEENTKLNFSFNSNGEIVYDIVKPPEEIPEYQPEPITQTSKYEITIVDISTNPNSVLEMKVNNLQDIFNPVVMELISNADFC